MVELSQYARFSQLLAFFLIIVTPPLLFSNGSFRTVPGILGIISIGLSAMALNQIKHHPELRGQGRARLGLIVGILATTCTLLAMVFRTP